MQNKGKGEKKALTEIQKIIYFQVNTADTGVMFRIHVNIMEFPRIFFALELGSWISTFDLAVVANQAFFL